MARRNKRKPMAEINVVPYIDVMMVLLVIFMISQPLLTQGVKVDLPQAETETLELEAADTMIAKVDRQGNYFLTLGDESERSVSANELIEEIRLQIKQKPETTILVAGDEKTEYSLVMNLLVLLNDSGVPSVGLMTRPIEEIK